MRNRDRRLCHFGARTHDDEDRRQHSARALERMCEVLLQHKDCLVDRGDEGIVLGTREHSITQEVQSEEAVDDLPQRWVLEWDRLTQPRAIGDECAVWLALGEAVLVLHCAHDKVEDCGLRACEQHRRVVGRHCGCGAVEP